MNFFLTMAFSFMVGLSDGGVQLWEPNTIAVQSDVKYTHTDFGAEFRLHYADVGYLFVGGGINCASVPEGSRLEIGNYSPHELDYPFNVGLVIKDHIEIGYFYQCSHPMMTYLYDQNTLKYKREGSFSMVYMKFTGEVKLWGK